MKAAQCNNWAAFLMRKYMFLPLGVGSILYGLFLIGRQIYNYLKFGKWEEYSAISLFKEWGFSDKWLQAPQDWIGIWQVLDSIHAGIFLFLISIVSFILAAVDQ